MFVSFLDWTLPVSFLSCCLPTRALVLLRSALSTFLPCQNRAEFRHCSTYCSSDSTILTVQGLFHVVKGHRRAPLPLVQESYPLLIYGHKPLKSFSRRRA